MWLWHGHVVFKSSIFVVQRATAPKNGVEFRQGSIGTIRSSLATSYDVWRRRQFSTNQRPRNYLTHTHTHTESTYCQALLYEQCLQKRIEFLGLCIFQKIFKYECRPLIRKSLTKLDVKKSKLIDIKGAMSHILIMDTNS